MKLLFYISTIGGGGAARVMTNLANQFCKNGNEVCLVTNFKSNREYHLDEHIMRIVLEKEISRSFFRKNMNRVCKLRKAIQNQKPDALISFMHENDVRAFVAQIGLKSKLILSVRNNPDDIYKNKIKRMIGRFIYRNADAVVFQTEDARNWFGNMKCYTAIMKNQIGEEFFATERKENEKNIVAVGKFMKQKNHMLLLQAYALIADSVDDDLIIYGEGKLRDEYKKYIEENNLQSRVFLPGSSTSIAQDISSAKVFVLTSEYEGVPNALIEAMALGIPCISTDCPCGGPRELLGDSEYGILLQKNTPEELAKKMVYLIENSDERKRMSVLSKKRAQRYAPECVFAEWNSFVRNVIGE